MDSSSLNLSAANRCLKYVTSAHAYEEIVQLSFSGQRGRFINDMTIHELIYLFGQLMSKSSYTVNNISK